MIYIILSLLSFSLLVLFLRWGKKRRKQDLRNLLEAGLKNPYRFEEFAREYLKEHGFRSVRTTRKSKDFGADIVAKRRGSTVVFQVKRRNSTVEKEVVKELVAAAYIYGATEVGIFTNSELSTGLKKELEELKRSGGFIKRVHVIKNINPEEF